MQINVLTTENESWGFFGTIGNHADVNAAWREAFVQIVIATGCSEVGVRDFLDSRHGRHFADDVANGLAAGGDLASSVAVVIGFWQGWTIGRRTRRENGIPAGLRYLRGWVAHFEICSDLAA